ncbi:hypothetical protein CBR_g31184 [Chara braunii]|uniref:Amine oxidase domain-containing protein n=1 Tax=Chara braunii TaxID=69332 RepID=A0A388JXN3_CHABU|nr:hypothetical protein CBR_g31184 [Chara braunii]|eukprot:GBG62545.1 hypothetical protein CBR_g31184 [Chara braunii]
MGTNAGPEIANLTLYWDEAQYVDNLQRVDPSAARRYAFTYRFIDDVLTFDCLPPSSAHYGLEWKETTATDGSCTFLGAKLQTRADGSLRLSVFDKTVAWDFPVIRYPSATSNIPSHQPAGVFTGQFTRFEQICDNWRDFKTAATMLVRRLLSRGHAPSTLACGWTCYIRARQRRHPIHVAIVGSGVSGLSAAWEIVKAGHEVVLYEKDNHVGGHAWTLNVDGIAVDVGFMVFNRVTYPNLVKFFEELPVEMEQSDMSFAVSLDGGRGCEWGSAGIGAFLAQKSNVVNPPFLFMIREMLRFERNVLEFLKREEGKEAGMAENSDTLGHFLNSHGYSQKFRQCYLIPVCASIWSCSVQTVLDFSAMEVFRFLRNHHMLQLLGRPQWLTLKGRSKTYVNKVVQMMEIHGSQVRTKCGIVSVKPNNSSSGVEITDVEGRKENLGETGRPVLVTLNPEKTPQHLVSSWKMEHPIPTAGAAKAGRELKAIQGSRGVWFCGAYLGYGFHEDGFKAGQSAAMDLLGKPFQSLPLVKQFVPSYLESFAKWVVLQFLKDFIKVGHFELLEAGGSVMSFGEPVTGINPDIKITPLRCSVRVIRPAFYWKVATRADLGIADAYVDGDFTCVGDMLDLLLVLIANRDRVRAPGKVERSTRPWWKPPLLTAWLGSAMAYFRHMTRNNTLTMARQNIVAHYDLSNDMFKLFLDETMTYSCAIFKDPSESLKTAQLRKLHALIDKARIKPHHRVLEIGFGWGSLSMEIVRRAGCHVTGITLSRRQLELAEKRVRAAGLQDKIDFKLVDYRNLPGIGCFDRILSCEMLEAVGHEYYGTFFQNCDRLLAPNGLLVVQVISTPEERYEEYRKSSDFIKEYIFPGSTCPSLTALVSAMEASSSFSLEHVENIGTHYATTLLRWRENFMSHKREIKDLGFSDAFIRTWDYYFTYCAAGFQTRTLGDLQLVFSRPGNVEALGLPGVL